MTHPDSLTRAEQFLSAHARPLERALFARRFRGGPAEPVVAALHAYRNADGGFGRALEPDVRAPESMALHAEVALRALADAGIRDAEIGRGLCRSLAAQAEPSGRVPIVDRAAVDAHPHAPHWSFPIFEGDSPNPTAAIVGLLRAQGAEDAWLDRAEAFCWERLAGPLEDAHEIERAVLFLENARDRARAAALARHVAALLPAAAHYRADAASGEYGLTPLRFCPRPDALLRFAFSQDVLAAHLAALAAEQQADGGWPIAFPTATPGALLEWRGIATFEALAVLQAWGRLAAPDAGDAGRR
jgi:hypothetical protein